MGEATSTKPIRVGIYYCIPSHSLSTSLSFEILSIYPHSTKDFSQMWIIYRRSLGITEHWIWNSVMPYTISMTLGKSLYLISKIQPLSLDK